MKISYILQLKDFFVLLAIGFGIGILYGLLNIPTTIKKRIIIQIITDLLFSFTSLSILLIAINVINMGEFRAFLVIGFILGIFLERISLGKLFAKGYKKVYNCLVKLMKKFANSKFGRIFLK